MVKNIHFVESRTRYWPIKMDYKQRNITVLPLRKERFWMFSICTKTITLVIWHLWIGSRLMISYRYMVAINAWQEWSKCTTWHSKINRVCFISVETTVPQVWWNRKFPTVKLAQFNLRDVPAQLIWNTPIRYWSVCGEFGAHPGRQLKKLS
jgi:hypothetical protein